MDNVMTNGFSAGMISTCLIDHYTNKETSVKDVLVGGVRDAAGGIKSVDRALLN